MRTAGAGRMIERRVEGGTGRSGRFFSEAGGRQLNGTAGTSRQE